MAAIDDSGFPRDNAASEQAAFWFARLRAEDCSEEERKRFATWLAQDEIHSREYDRLLQTWQVLDGLKDQFAGLYPPPARAKRFSSRWVPMALAASLLAAISIGWHGFNGAESYSTAIGEQKRVTLADGTEAHLGADTRISVEMSEGLRHIRLERGEALFTVAPGNRPFAVDAGNGTIRDIGTRFNVRQDDNRVTVAVLEGQVEIRSSGAVQRLSKGQQTHYSEQSLAAPSSLDLDTAAAWRQGKLVFDGSPLSEVVHELQRYHDRPIVITAPALGNLKVSGVFNAADLDGLLETLQQVLPLKVEKDGETLRLLPASTPPGQPSAS